MPSTRDPVTTVLPGPGRLPANTVSASALIFPPGGGSSAALTAHITDPVDAHQASAIGQSGYAAANATWVEAVAGVGGTQNALTKLFDSANARPTWVLDANPANKGDFVGPNALINAVAAAGVHYPNLFLRPGTYNWNDAVAIGTFTIIGGRRDTTIIQNLAGDLRTSGNATFKNLIIELSGDLKVMGGFGGGHNTFQDISLDVTGVIDVSSTFNTFDRITGLSGGQVMEVTGGGTTVRNLFQVAVHLDTTAINSDLQDVFFISGWTRSLVTPLIHVDTSGSQVRNIYASVDSFNASCFKVGGSAVGCILENLTAASMATLGVNFRAFEVASGSLQNKMSGLFATSLDGTGFVQPLISIDGSEHMIDDIRMSDLVNFSVNLLKCASTSSFCTISAVRVVDVTGQVANFIDPQGTGHALLGVSFESTASAGASSLLALDTSLTKNLVVSKLVTDVSTATGASPVAITNTTADFDSIITLLDCVLRGYSGSVASALSISTGSKVVLERVQVSTTFATSAPAINVLNSRIVTGNDCVFTAGNGKACNSQNSGTTLTKCQFIGGSSVPNAGNQLFTGHGSSSLIAPNNPTQALSLVDCTMEYGSSNTDPLLGTGAGEPVIFFGGVGGTATTNHGPTNIYGLSIAPGSSVVNQHRDGLVLVDLVSQNKAANPGVYKDITLNLKEIKWAATGLGRGAVFTINGNATNGDGSFRRSALVENLAIKNIKENDIGFDDRRTIFRALAVKLNGLILDGPTITGVNGTNGFCESLVFLNACEASNIRIGYERGIKLKLVAPVTVIEYLYLYESLVDTVDIRVGVAGSVFSHLCRMSGSTLTKAVMSDSGSGTRLGAGLRLEGTASGRRDYVDDVLIEATSALSSTMGLEVESITLSATISNVRVYAPSNGAAGQECLRILDSVNVVVSDSTFYAEGGRAGHVNNSGATLERVSFLGGFGAPSAGTQLFTGWGRTGSGAAPLIIRDCLMEYGDSNCNAAAGSGTGEPVIFLGGILGSVTAFHGPIMVDGLRIRTSFTVVNQHRDSILLIDTAGTVPSNYTQRNQALFRNIEIDLQEITWSASGTGRSTSGFITDAAIFGVNAGYAIPTSFESLKIVNIKEDAISDGRHFLTAQGYTSFSNVQILGPGSGTHGAGSFSNQCVYLAAPTICSDFVIGGANGVKVSGASATHLYLAFLSGSRQDMTLSNVLIGAPDIAVTPHSLLWADDGFVDLSGVTAQVPSALVAPSTAVVYCTARASFRDCVFSGANAVPVVFLDSGANDADYSILEHNQILTLSTGGIGLKLNNVDHCSATSNSFTHHSTTEPAIHLDGFRNKIIGNSIKGAAGSTWLTAVLATSADFNTIADNDILDIGETSALAAEIGTIHVLGNSFRNIIRNNIIHRSIAYAGDLWCPIVILGDFNTVLGNNCDNPIASPGTCTIVSRGLTGNITGNTVTGDHSTLNSTIGIVSYIGSRGVIVGNVSHNRDAGTASTIASVGGDTLAGNNAT